MSELESFSTSSTIAIALPTIGIVLTRSIKLTILLMMKHNFIFAFNYMVVSCNAFFLSCRGLLKLPTIPYQRQTIAPYSFNVNAIQSPDLLLQEPEEGWRLTNGAEFGDLIKVLSCLDSGTDINYKDMDGWTALHHAARKGHFKLLQLLLQRGINKEVLDKEGKTAFDVAEKGPARDYLEDFTASPAFSRLGDPTYVSQPPVPLEVTPGGYFLNAAKKGDESEVLICLGKGDDIDTKDDWGNTALHFSANRGFLSLVQILLQKGIDVSAVNMNGKTATDIANGAAREALTGYIATTPTATAGTVVPIADSPPLPSTATATVDVPKVPEIEPELIAVSAVDAGLFNAVKNKDINGARTILDFGANVNAIDEDGTPSLQWAVKGGSIGVVEMLLEKGADISIPDKDGRLSSHYAAYHGKDEVLNILLARGINIEATNTVSTSCTYTYTFHSMLGIHYISGIAYL
jgi:ankyrin repeat protein